MSSSDLSYNILLDRDNEPAAQSFVKYLDIDSTYRNRKDYPNPNDFVIPITYPGRDSTAATAIDPVIDSIPYTGSINPPGVNVTGISTSPVLITLDVGESIIDNFYIDSFLQVSGEYRRIIKYNGTSKTATIESPFSVLPSNGTVYYTRRSIPFFTGSIVASPAPTINSFALNSLASSINGIYINSYVRFTSGPNTDLVFRIVSYDGSNRQVTVFGNIPVVPTVGTIVELVSFTRDNASTLLYSNTSGTSNQSGYYEIELLWISVPNQILGTGYGGTLDRYPYVYVRLFNEGNRLTNQSLFSNNPNSTLALFKVPVDQYFGNTSFITLTNAKTKQVIRFENNTDLRFTVTLPSGVTVKFSESDNFTPMSPDPFLQVNALFSIKRL